MARMNPLNTYWSAAREDNFTTSTEAGRLAAQAAGYVFVGNEGWVEIDQPGGGVPDFSARLESYWSAERGDNFLTATEEGRRAAREGGYGPPELQGWVYTRGGSAELVSWWSSRRQDNFTTARPEGNQTALGAGYGRVRTEGYLHVLTGGLRTFWSSQRADQLTARSAESALAAAAAGYQFIRAEVEVPADAPGTVPFKLYWHGGRQDHITVASQEGERSARDAGYRLVREEGRVFSSEAAIPADYEYRREVRLYWHAERQDNFTTASEEGWQSAEASGYGLVRVEGFVAARSIG